MMNFRWFVLHLKAVFTVYMYILTSHLAPGRCVDAVQGALVQEVAGRRAALRSAWTPSITVTTL